MFTSRNESLSKKGHFEYEPIREMGHFETGFLRKMNNLEKPHRQAKNRSLRKNGLSNNCSVENFWLCNDEKKLDFCHTLKPKLHLFVICKVIRIDSVLILQISSFVFLTSMHKNDTKPAWSNSTIKT